MRLIHTTTHELREFQGNVQDESLPAYAILSHRWRNDETDFQSFTNGDRKESSGHRKVTECCQFANSRGLDWLWVDTCCIDKRSSAELSEAINSMWDWYASSVECYAYLDDVSLPLERFRTPHGVLTSCDWIRRGWTLQELIAPNTVLFMARSWQPLGRKWRQMLAYAASNNVEIIPPDYILRAHEETRYDVFRPADLLDALVRVTSIPAEVLDRREALDRQSVAVKMSWMAERKTTRAEDMAYCLLGLFHISMPLLYGEGNKAFQRLQEEILRQTSDESIFAWNTLASNQRLLALSPKHFLSAGNVRRTIQYDRIPYSMTNQGLRFEYSLGDGVHEITKTGATPPSVLIVLNCCTAFDVYTPSCVLYLEPAACGHYIRCHTYFEHIERALSSSELKNIKRPHSMRYDAQHSLRRHRPDHSREKRSGKRTSVIYIHAGDAHNAACEVFGALGVEPELELMDDISERGSDV